MYEIAIRGRLPHDWPHWFEGFTVVVGSTTGGPLTTLTGPVTDQAQLHGVLARLRDLALPIEWVRHLPNAPRDT